LVSNFEEGTYRVRVFENRELRKILGPKREEDRSWRKFVMILIFHLILLGWRMRWMGHEACMGEGSSINRVLIGPKGRDQWEDLV
jgi:hypothetical protein